MAKEMQHFYTVFIPSSVTTRTPTTEDEAPQFKDEFSSITPHSKFLDKGYPACSTKPTEMGLHANPQFVDTSADDTNSFPTNSIFTRPNLLGTMQRIFSKAAKRMQLVFSTTKTWIEWSVSHFGPKMSYLFVSLLLGFATIFSSALFLVTLGLSSGYHLLVASPLIGPLLGIVHWMLTFIYDLLRSSVFQFIRINRPEFWQIIMLRFFIYFGLSLCWYTAWMTLYLGAGGFFLFDSLAIAIPACVLARSLIRIVLQSFVDYAGNKNSLLLEEVVYSDVEFYGKCDVFSGCRSNNVYSKEFLNHKWPQVDVDAINGNTNTYSALPSSSIGLVDRQSSSWAENATPDLLSSVIAKVVSTCYFVFDGILSFALIAFIIFIAGNSQAGGYIFSHAIIFAFTTTSMTQLSGYAHNSLESYLMESDQLSVCDDDISKFSKGSDASNESPNGLSCKYGYGSKEDLLSAFASNQTECLLEKAAPLLQ